MLRLSTGARNAQVSGLGLTGVFNRFFIQVWSGSQPANADAASTGATLLGVASQNSQTPAYEIPATGSITLATGAAGSVNTVTVGGLNIIPDGAVPFRTSLAQTAADLCDAINRNGMMIATVSGAVVTITPRPGAGAALNSAAVTATLTTLTATYANISGGANGANGLILGAPTAGVANKSDLQTYSFLGLAAGTAGWFRMIGAAGDSGLAVSAAPWLARIDGSIGVSGADASMSNLAVQVGVPNTIDVWSLTMPAQ
jgi:hypothetical protein